MAIQITVELNEQSFRRKILAAIEPILRERAERAGRDMARRATELMAQDFDLNRPYERRRHPGSRRAASAIDYFVRSLDEDTVEVGYRILGGPVVEARIAGMNYGTPAHRIEPSGAWSLKDVTLAIRNVPRLAGRSSTDVLAWVNGGGLAVAAYVDNHPGTTGSHFLERARDEIVASLQ